MKAHSKYFFCGNVKNRNQQVFHLKKKLILSVAVKFLVLIKTKLQSSWKLTDHLYTEYGSREITFQLNKNMAWQRAVMNMKEKLLLTKRLVLMVQREEGEEAVVSRPTVKGKVRQLVTSIGWHDFEAKYTVCKMEEMLQHHLQKRAVRETLGR